jgi:hypothetical protein
MQNSQLITVTVEVSGDVDPQAAVDTINGATNDGAGYWIGTAAGTPEHKVEGEPYRAGTRGQDVYLGAVTLVK